MNHDYLLAVKNIIGNKNMQPLERLFGKDIINMDERLLANKHAPQHRQVMRSYSLFN